MHYRLNLKDPQTKRTQNKKQRQLGHFISHHIKILGVTRMRTHPTLKPKKLEFLQLEIRSLHTSMCTKLPTKWVREHFLHTSNTDFEDKSYIKKRKKKQQKQMVITTIRILHTKSLRKMSVASE